MNHPDFTPQPQEDTSPFTANTENNTPPAANIPPAQPPAAGVYAPNGATPPPENTRTRRVGTFTMALSLIAVGVLLIARLFLPSLTVLSVLQFSPVILIFLGIEILLSYAFNEEKKMKYDGLSIFFSIILIGASLLASFVPEYITQEIRRNQLSERFSQQIVDKSFDTLGKSSISRLESFVSINHRNLSADASMEDLKPEDYVQVRVFLHEPGVSAEAFAKECHGILQQLLPVLPRLNYISFHSLDDNLDYDLFKDGDTKQMLSLNNPFQLNWDAKEMQKNVYTGYFLKESYDFVSLSQYEEVMQQRQLEEAEYQNSVENPLPTEEVPAPEASSDIPEEPQTSEPVAA